MSTQAESIQARRDYAVLAQELAEGRLSPEGFDHRAHLGAAYEIITRHDVFEGMAIYARGLRDLTLAAGVPEKFNATVTLGFLSLTAERAATRSYRDAAHFLEENEDLLTAKALQDHYTSEQLQTELARRVPLLPRR